MVPIFYFHVLDDLDAADGEDSLLPDLESALLRAGGEAGILMCGLASNERFLPREAENTALRSLCREPLAK